MFLHAIRHPRPQSLGLILGDSQVEAFHGIIVEAHHSAKTCNTLISHGISKGREIDLAGGVHSHAEVGGSDELKPRGQDTHDKLRCGLVGSCIPSQMSAHP